MRSRYHTANPAWAVNLSEAPAPRPAFPVQAFALDLPIEQRAAMVLLRKMKEGAQSAAGQVMARLDAEKVKVARFAELQSESYVTVERTGYRLTPKGHHASNDIIKDFCFRYSIHVFRLEGGKGSGGGTWTRCSCGTWHSGPHNNDRFGQSRIRTAQAAHHRDVESGQWPAGRLNDFLNKVAPPQFDFGSGNPGADVGRVDGTVPGVEGQ